MRKSLLDTSILISFLKGEQNVVKNVAEYVEEHHRISLSLLSYYEVLRGLNYLGNERKIRRFEALMEDSELIPLDRAIMKRASALYAALMRRGELIEDADILIAASCLINGLVLVTDNEEHFGRIENLEVANWLK